MEDRITAEDIKDQPEGQACSEMADAACQYTCDRCGSRMIERSCKIVCHNCGHRFDCSDLNLYFD